MSVWHRESSRKWRWVKRVSLDADPANSRIDHTASPASGSLFLFLLLSRERSEHGGVFAHALVG